MLGGTKVRSYTRQANREARQAEHARVAREANATQDGGEGDWERDAGIGNKRDGDTKLELGMWYWEWANLHHCGQKQGDEK